MNLRVKTALSEGAVLGRTMVGHPRGEACMLGQYGVIEQHRTLVGPNGEALQPSSKARREVDIAFAQGFIAAYRSTTEFSHE